MSPDSVLSPDDLRLLADRGIDSAEAERQLRLLHEPPPPARLLRPATVCDGIDRLGEGAERERREAAAAAVAADRLLRFVPASGAASRMFADWVALAERGEEGLERFIAALEHLPFQERIAAALAALGLDAERLRQEPKRSRPLLRRLLAGGHSDAGSPEGSPSESGHSESGGLAALPKGLVPFHRIDGEGFSAAQEQLFEAAALAGAGRRAAVHFTVSAEHHDGFQRALAPWAAEIGERTGVELSVGLSVQDPATDTLALDEDGSVARDHLGRLRLRPGGHGALLANLAATGADLVLIKNIDNVLPHDRQGESVEVQRQLLGQLLAVEKLLGEQLAALERAPHDRKVLDRVRAFCSEILHLALPAEIEAAAIRERLARPLRVCGVVPNLGEPGGGPFWVASTAEGEPEATLQIVETSQVDTSDPGQRGILEQATHFNPVLLLCALRPVRGESYLLEHYVDERTSFVSTKRENGRSLRVLERPGLWNGAMAGWITLFVEIPASTFAPVKSVWDLLRPERCR